MGDSRGADVNQDFNQVDVLEAYNLFATDPILQQALAREGAGWHAEALHGVGERLGTPDIRRLGELANSNPPQFTAHDRLGRRIDRVDFHPAWHRLLNLLYQDGVHCLPWAAPRPGAYAARAAAFYLHGQIEAGTLCPTTMSFAAIPLLMREPGLGVQLRDKLLAREHDARDLPIAEKRALTIGMGMTEKQGGSDLRSNRSGAVPIGAAGRGERYCLSGHKWFFSAPSSDAHLVLALADGALSCFWVPRWRDDGTRNAVHLVRLKDKLGNRSNASAEVEFHEAEGVLVGEPGRGIATIIEMASYTRLDCVLGSAALLRQALVQAMHYARHRFAFGRPLIEQPLMRAVIADLALESAAAVHLALRLAGACERAAQDPLERALWRIVTPAAKFWVCKRAIAAVAECMEVLGGNGYVEDWPLARLYREAPVNSIWEGSGNVMCLDVLRGLARDREAAQALCDFIAGGAPQGAQGRVDTDQLLVKLRAAHSAEREARWTARQLVLVVQARLLAEAAPAVADVFAAARHGDAGIAGVMAEAIPAKTADEILAEIWRE